MNLSAKDCFNLSDEGILYAVNKDRKSLSILDLDSLCQGKVVSLDCRQFSDEILLMSFDQFTRKISVYLDDGGSKLNTTAWVSYQLDRLPLKQNIVNFK